MADYNMGGKTIYNCGGNIPSVIIIIHVMMYVEYVNSEIEVEYI